MKEALLLLYLVLDHASIGAALNGSDWLAGQVALYALLAAGLWLAGRARSAVLRWLLALTGFVAAAFAGTMARAMGAPLSYDLFLNMVESAGFVGDALAQHGGAIAKGVLCALPLLPAIGLAPRRALSSLAGAAAPALATLALTFALFLRGGEGAGGLPTAYPPLAYALLAGAEAVATPKGKRAAVPFTPGRPQAAGDIVLLVDESISAKYLDIVHHDGVETGLRTPSPGVAAHSFGVAASITNCSVGTNVTLRHGGTRADYARINAIGPSIWAYARKAGYATVYLDAQRTDGAFQNRMDGREAMEIVEFVQFGDTIVRDRDQAVADRLGALLDNGRRDFILVNKLGAHFPVQDKFPDAVAQYQPILPRGFFGGIAETGERDGFTGDPASWVRYRNAYRNTLLWNVRGFFARLFGRGIGNATILYTGDHGQQLHEDGSAGVNTHCGDDPAPEEGAVPLAVVAGDKAGGPDWAAAAQRNRDRASHFQLFPTILALMGYRTADVAPAYGKALNDPLTDELRFNTRFNARLGRQPEWKRIDPAALAVPPRSDFESGGLP